MRKPERSPRSPIVPVDAGGIERAGAIIGSGGVVALPTETSYGLAVDPFNEAALERLFALKRRPLSKPVLVLIDQIDWLPRLAAAIPDCYPSLFKRFWPGPLTMIFPARPELSLLLTGGTGTVGIRISSEPVAGKICRSVKGPITATSANISNREPALSAAQVMKQFDDALDLIVDGGRSSLGPPSTIIAEQDGELRLIRNGRINFSTIVFEGN